MARESNKNEQSDADRSKEWVIEVTPSVDGQENLARAIDLILKPKKEVPSQIWEVPAHRTRLEINPCPRTHFGALFCPTTLHNRHD
jgi:hypothetical protein